MNLIDPSHIYIPYPATPELNLKITTGVCSLTLSPGFGNNWITGKYSDPKELAPLDISQAGKTTHIVVGDLLRDWVPEKHRPHLHLSFGKWRAFSLTISTGDIDNHFDFGCLPLSALEINCGAGHQVINFSYANPQLMNKMMLNTDAGSVLIQNIANANAAEVRMKGDATNCRLDFGGELKRNTFIHIGMVNCNVAVSIPMSTAAKITSPFLPDSHQMADFICQGKAYYNGAAYNHQEPLLRIHQAAAMGSFRIQTF